MPDADNVTTIENESTVLPYNIHENETVDVCKRPQKKIIGGMKASQGDFPYQVSFCEPIRTAGIADQRTQNEINIR